jgi:hypothetical protein
MSQYDFLLGDRLMQTNVEEAQRWVAGRNRLRQAGLLREAQLSRQLRRHAHRLGGMLVALGERMKRLSLPQAQAFDPQLSKDKAQ